MLLHAVIWMNLALIFYTWAVFSGRKHGLHRKHLIIFGVGLLCDYLGTQEMNLFARAYGKAPEWHNITGIADWQAWLSIFCWHSSLPLPRKRGSQPCISSRQSEHLHLLVDRLFQRRYLRHDAHEMTIHAPATFHSMAPNENSRRNTFLRL